MQQRLFILCVVVGIVAVILVQKNRLTHPAPLNISITNQAQSVSGGVSQDGIPTINAPAFESVVFADAYLDDYGLGLLLERSGQIRYYPFQILTWHLLVNDMVGDEPVLISYSPFTGSALAFDRMIDGTIESFGLTGSLFDGASVLYDYTSSSHWSHASGLVFEGDRIGTRMERLPAMIVRWQDVRDREPSALVLSRDTGFDRDYTRDPYDVYETNNDVAVGLSRKDARLHPKSAIYGFDAGTEKVAWTQQLIQDSTVINDTVGEGAVLLVWDDRWQTARAFNRKVKDRIFTFDVDGSVLIDRETNSRWNMDGEAFSGSVRGARLDPIALERHFWFSWYATHPNSRLEI